MNTRMKDTLTGRNAKILADAAEIGSLVITELMDTNNVAPTINSVSVGRAVIAGMLIDHVIEDLGDTDA